MYTHRELFGRVEELKNQKVKMPGIAILKDGDRYIYYLITKRFPYEQSYFDYVYTPLKEMFNHMVTLICFYIFFLKLTL